MREGEGTRVGGQGRPWAASEQELLISSPPDSGEGLGRHHVQRVPGRDAQAVVKAQHEDHHGLAGAEPQEEATDA